MKTLLLFFILILPVGAEPINLTRLRDAIAMVETGNNSNRIGGHGETGAMQMSLSAKMDGMDENTRLRWIISRLPLAGMPVNETTIALAWHCGMNNVRMRVFSEKDFDYAKRVKNLYLYATKI